KKNELHFDIKVNKDVEGLDLRTSMEARTLRFSLQIDGKSHPEKVFIGLAGKHPSGMPFTLPAHPGQASRKAPPPVYSKLVHPGKDGKLVYAADDRGNRVPDFSGCGYKGGGVALPSPPVKATVTPGGSGDDGSRIQAAIDAVSRLPPDKNGFRGAVLL